ncbi:MAG: class I SAM-dependent methyltransferase [Gammaproteobacteria bacterium]|nr:class I SAM-dependent methyltransferase [Gammaproteobacteria bacterium]
MPSPLSRENPSPRYRELTDMYREMHLHGEKFLGIPADRTFPGMSLPPQAARIRRMIERTGAANILDYGSGKGLQYESSCRLADGTVVENVQDYWGVDFVQCYDPSFPPFSQLPTGKFDGVISTDVLEHCPEEDIPWIVEEMFSFADRFVFANVACYQAKKRLPNGENAHCTIKPVEWWIEVMDAVAGRRSGLVWEVWIQHVVAEGGVQKLIERRIGSPEG